MFRFSMRELMVVVMAAAMWFAWLAEYGRREAALVDAKQARQETEKAKKEALAWRRTNQRLIGEHKAIERQLADQGLVIRPSFGSGPKVYKRAATPISN